MSTDPTQDAERAKYEKVWSDRAYARQADGEPVVDIAYEKMGCQPGETLIDWGCGCGRPAAKFQDKGLKVTGIDIAKNCLDTDVKIPLVVGSLWDLPISLDADYAFSTDVLEHIPPEKLDGVLLNIRVRTRKAAFLQVCTVLDSSGPKMDPPMRLHLSIHPVEWWRLKIGWYFKIVEELPVGGKSRSAFVCFNG